MDDADKANDITFGDIGNVRAGDVASEQLWAADHDALAKKIEAEKEGLLRARRGGYQQPISNFYATGSNLTTSPPSRLSPSLSSIGIHSHHQNLGEYSSFGSNSHLQSSDNISGSQRFGDIEPGELHSSIEQSYSPLQFSNLPAPLHHNVKSRLPSSGVQHLSAHVHQPPSTQLLQRMEMERLIQIQREEFVARNNQLAPEELERLLAQYHDHFVSFATSKISGLIDSRVGVGGARQSPPVGSFESGPPVIESVRSGPQSPLHELKSSALSVNEIESVLRSSHISKPVKRVLPTMTDKDLEVVLRMHLKQLDGTVPYRDDFYSVMYDSARENEPEVEPRHDDMYEELGTYIGAVVDKKSRISEPIMSRDRSQRRKRERTRKNTEKRTTNSKNVKASSNLKTLTHVLGTIQAWNPKARRRVMDITAATSTGKPTSKPMSRITGEHRVGEHRLMRDDERIHVRAAVESGYDLLGKLQDVTRKHANHDVSEILNHLVDTLRLSPPSNKHEQEDAFSSFESTRFFVRMCVFEKGKRYIARILSVLPARHGVRIVTAVFENLSVLLYEIAPSGDEDSHDVLWAAIISTVRKPEFPAQQCMDVLAAFCRTHSSDSGAIIFSLTTSVGAKLLYFTMQRIFTAQNDDPPLYLTSDNVEWDALCTALTDRLGDAFDAAESSDNVWEVAAMLDALSIGDTRDALRSTLKSLMDSGRAPPPPQT